MDVYVSTWQGSRDNEGIQLQVCRVRPLHLIDLTN